MLTHLIAAAMGAADPIPPGAPDAPTGLTLTDNSTCASCTGSYDVQLDWTDGDTEDVRIYREGVLIATVSAGVETYQDTGGAIGVEQLYQIRHWDGSQESATEFETITSSPCPDVDAPTGTATATGSTTIEIDVDGQPDADEWKVYRDGTETLVGTITNPAVPLEDTGRDPGTEYTYDIEAVDSSTGCTSDTRTSVSAFTDLAAPTVTVTATGKTTVEIDVDAQTGADEWNVYRAGTATLVGTITDDTVALEDTGRDPDTTYCYDVEAVDSSGNRATSEKTTNKCATTWADTPSNVAAELDEGECPSLSMNVSWDLGGNTGDQVKVERSDDGGTFSEVDNSPYAAGTSEITDDGGTGGFGNTDAQYRVSFVGESGTALSNTESVECPPT